VLAKLSNLFWKLSAKELSPTVIADMERMASMLLCKLEKIFPPGFFNPMQHMILQLPYEAQMGGQCKPIGAIQLRDVKKVLRTKCEDKCKIEASIAEAFIGHS